MYMFHCEETHVPNGLRCIYFIVLHILEYLNQFYSCFFKNFLLWNIMDKKWLLGSDLTYWMQVWEMHNGKSFKRNRLKNVEWKKYHICIKEYSIFIENIIIILIEEKWEYEEICLTIFNHAIPWFNNSSVTL